jgi:hypothetical protein
MSVVVPIALSCRPRVLPGHKVTRNTSTTDIGADTDTDFIGACTPALSWQLTEYFVKFASKDKAIALQARTGREGYRRLRLPDFKTIGT